MKTITAIVAAALAGSASAQFAFTVDSDASSIAGSIVISIATDGTLIGDYDPDTNPDGTQTRTGLFGGSGNNPIPVSIDTTSTTDLDLGPAGAFNMNADTDALTFTIADFNADMLNGQTVTSMINATFLYDTFHTVNPDMLYLGGIPLPVDLDAAEFTTYTTTQAGPMDPPGVLIPAEANAYTLAGQIPVEITVVGSAFGNPVEPAPTAGVLPITGTLTLHEDGSATVQIAVDLGDMSQEFDTSTLPPLPDIPFELPTLGTETAGVILSLSVSAAGLDAAGAIDLIANADAAGCNAADFAEPFGTLDLADLSAFIVAFTTGDASADLTGDGLVDLADIQAFITAFTAGCP